MAFETFTRPKPGRKSDTDRLFVVISGNRHLRFSAAAIEWFGTQRILLLYSRDENSIAFQPDPEGGSESRKIGEKNHALDAKAFLSHIGYQADRPMEFPLTESDGRLVAQVPVTMEKRPATA